MSHKISLKKRSGIQGFTLLEILLYTASATALLLAVSIMLSVMLETRIKTENLNELNWQGTAVMQSMTQALRNATGINQPTLGNHDTSLSVKIADAGKDPTVFDLTGGVLYIKEGSSTKVALSNSRFQASNLQFINLGNTSTTAAVRIEFTLACNNSSGRTEFDCSQTFVGSGSLR